MGACEVGVGMREWWKGRVKERHTMGWLAKRRYQVGRLRISACKTKAWSCNVTGDDALTKLCADHV